MTVATQSSSDIADRKRDAAIAELDRNGVKWREPVREAVRQETEVKPTAVKQATPADRKRAKRRAARKAQATANPVTSEQPTAYECGYKARLDNCHRVLCNPVDDNELREWQRGWDAADLLQRYEVQPLDGTEEFQSSADAVEMSPADIANVIPLTAEEHERIAPLFKSNHSDGEWGNWTYDDERWTLTPHELRKLKECQAAGRVAGRFRV